MPSMTCETEKTMLSPSPNNPPPRDVDLTGQPGQAWFFQWVLGLVLPLAAVAYGVVAIAARHVSFGNDRYTLELHGVNAVAFGGAVVSLGIFLHCHSFWGHWYDDHWAAVLGKIVAGIGFAASAGTLLVRVGVYGMT